MATIAILRYSSAKTKAALLKEVANADSRDFGCGDQFGGLCVRVEKGQDFDPLSLLDDVYRDGYKLNLDGAQSSAAWLEADIETQGITESRKMWRMVVNSDDIISLCGRSYGGLVQCYDADGVVLRRGAQVHSVETVKL